METTRRAFKAIVSVLCLSFCIILLTFAVIFKINNYKILTVQSNSMNPQFSVGDVLFVKPQSEYALGDVVSYNHNGLIITHRIVEISDNNYICVGDNAQTSQTINQTDIIGKAQKLPNFLAFLIKIRFFIFALLIFLLFKFTKLKTKTCKTNN